MEIKYLLHSKLIVGVSNTLFSELNLSRFQYPKDKTLLPYLMRSL